VDVSAAKSRHFSPNHSIVSSISNTRLTGGRAPRSQNALAAIVLNSVFGLFDYEEFKFLWKVSKKDCLLWLVSFLGTLFLGIELGIAIAVRTRA
jgi:hypothetical protein